MNKAFLASLLLLCSFSTAQAQQQPWDGPAFSAKPAELLNASQAAGGADKSTTIVFLEERTISLDASHRMVDTHRFVLRLGSKDAEPWSAIEETWSPWRQQKPTLRARVITPDGREIQLDQKTLSEAPVGQAADTVFGDARVVRGPLPGLSPGALIELQTITRDTAPLLDRGVTQRILFALGAPVLHSILTIDAPTSLTLNNVVHGLPGVIPKRETKGGRTVLTFDSGRLEPIKSISPFSPGDSIRYIGFSTSKSWSEIADNYARLVEDQIGKSNISDFARETFQGAATREEKLGAALAKVQQTIRYSAVQLGAAAIVPTPPADTVRLKYGDCKDQAALLVSMLRTTGIEAHVALLSTSALDMDESLPGFGLFDHAIVYVPGETPLWLDPTTGFTRLGQLPVDDQNKGALIAKSGTTSLVRTPELRSKPIETHEIFLSELGKARAVHTEEYSGAQEIALREGYANLDAAAIQEAIRKSAKQMYETDKVEGIRVSDPRDFSKPFQVRYETLDSQFATTDSTQAAVALGYDSLVTDLAFFVGISEGLAAAGQGQGIVLPETFVRENRVRIVPPASFEKPVAPANETKQFGPLRISREFSIAADGIVTGVLRVETPKRSFTRAEMDELKMGLTKLDEESMLVSYTSIGGSRLDAGDIKGAIAEFRRMTKLHPLEALHHTQLADALLRSGLGESAREEARKAVALEPTNPASYNMLGWVLQHDLISRRFGKGAEVQQALDAYRKALELDSKNHAARLNLAVVLEYDPNGNRYGSGANLNAAIEQYRLMGESSSDDPNYHNLTIALLRANRFAEARQASKRSDLTLAAIVGAGGIEAAVREATRLIPSSEARETAFGQAAAQLLQSRAYPEAAAMYRVAARGAANATALTDQAIRIEKMKRYDEASLPKDAPASVVKKYTAWLYQQKPQEEILSLFTKEGRDRGVSSLRDVNVMRLSLPQPWTGVRPSQEVLLDDVLASWTITKEGNDTIGYRITLKDPTDRVEAQDAYVVREDGEYKILAGPFDRSLARLALQRAERNDLEGGRLLVEWAIDEQRPSNENDPNRIATEAAYQLWDRGQKTATRDEIRYAAAAILSTGPDAATALTILQEGRAKPGAARITGFDFGIAGAYRTLGRVADAVKIMEPINMNSARTFVLAAMTAQNKPEELKAYAQRSLDRNPRDFGSTRALADAEFQLGNYDRAQSLYSSILDVTPLTGPASLGWLALFRESYTTADIDRLKRLPLLTLVSTDGSPQYTLAALYADLGLTNEAREAILQAMAIGTRKEPGADDWYVFGRIWEELGEREAAKTAYQRVKKPEANPNRADSAYVLAQRRLSAMEDKR
jgi:tetratricopeptide (TPR) repeat protein